MPVRGEFDNGERRNGTQVMWPDHADQTAGQFRQIVVELFPQAAHQKGEAFKQAFHIRVARARFVEI
ncbi:Uncharacterised protein [Klebsiella pneumoniae]|nr:Uncharacterised protein [Klebsiella pneumoniae]